MITDNYKLKQIEYKCNQTVIKRCFSNYSLNVVYHLQYFEAWHADIVSVNPHKGHWNFREKFQVRGHSYP